MVATPRLPADETGDQGLLSHTPTLRVSFWTLWEHVWTDPATKDATDLKELIRFRSARHADCFA